MSSEQMDCVPFRNFGFDYTIKYRKWLGLYAAVDGDISNGVFYIIMTVIVIKIIITDSDYEDVDDDENDNFVSNNDASILSSPS